MDTLAVRLTVPPTGPVKDFHLQVGAPCRAHEKKANNEKLIDIIAEIIRLFHTPESQHWGERKFSSIKDNEPNEIFLG